MTIAPLTRSDDLAAAQRRDEAAFARLTAPHRAGLQAHCYRMLGSAADAEDALQETLLRAWRGLPAFEGRSSLRSWLYRIATNVCLKAIERRPRRLMPVDHGPPAGPDEAAAEPLDAPWLEPYPDATLEIEQRESVELAFAAAVQHLPPRQRAVLLLRDVLGFSPAEIAVALETTPAAVSSALQRAHAVVEERMPARTQQATLRAIGDARLKALVERYVRAWERADVDAIAALLAEDVVLAMPPRPTWFRGRDTVTAFLAAVPLAGGEGWRRVPVRASGQLAFGVYGTCERPDRGLAHAIEVLALDDRGRIAAIDSFQRPEAFRRFGLPSRLDT